MVVVKKRLFCIIKKNKKWIKERERDRYKLMTVEERKAKTQKSLETYYRLKKLNIKNE